MIFLVQLQESKCLSPLVSFLSEDLSASPSATGAQQGSTVSFLRNSDMGHCYETSLIVLCPPNTFVFGSQYSVFVRGRFGHVFEDEGAGITCPGQGVP